MPKPQLIDINKIENKFDVRVKLNDDRVLYFAELIESGVELPPIVVMLIAPDTYAFKDGRHRAAAFDFCGRTQIPAYVEPYEKGSEARLYAEALEANAGGALPPTTEDIAFVVIKMLELGTSGKTVKEYLRWMPESICTEYIKKARGVIKKRKERAALNAIANEGLTVAAAAEKYSIDINTIKGAIQQGKKTKAGEAELERDMKSIISRSLASANATIRNKMYAIFTKVRHGEMSHAAAGRCIESWEKHLKQSTSNIRDWRARLEQASSDTSKDLGGAA